MRKVKQVDRPYLIYRYGTIGRTLYDSQTTLDHAKAVASRMRGKVEIYHRRPSGHELVFSTDLPACERLGAQS